MPEDLETAIESSLEFRNHSPVSLNGFDHLTIARAFQKFVYEPKYQNLEISIVFSDNSICSPFPIGCLPPPSEKLLKYPEGLLSLKIGLMSLHTPKLDHEVDFYITRSGEFERELSAADIENYSYQRVVSLLNDPALEAGGIIHIYRTEGLEAIVVGYYRGIVKLLQERIKYGLPRSLIFKVIDIDKKEDVPDCQFI